MENTPSPAVVTPGSSAGDTAGKQSAPVVTTGNNKKPGLSRNRLYSFVAAGVIVLAATAGYTFAYYLPNKPENVWKSALSNTADGYAKLIDYANTAQKDKTFETTQLDGDFKVVSSGASTDGTMSGTMDDKSAVLSANVGFGVTRVKVDSVVKDVSNSESPDVYLKLSGIKGLGEQLMGTSELDTLDDQWVTVDHTLLDNLLSQASQAGGAEASSLSNPKEEDVVAAAKVAGEQLNQYVFTTQSDKTVLNMDTFVGKETVDGKSTSHYKVKVNKAHLKAFVKSLGTELDKTKLNTWLKDTYGQSFSKALDTEDVTSSIDSIKDDQTFDVWVNNKTKLIHKVKFAENKNPATSFVELGLNYNGGDELPFFVNLKADESGQTTNCNVSFSVNTKTNVVKMGLVIDDGKAESQGAKMTFNATFKPASKKVDATAPAGAISLVEAMNKAGLGGLFSMFSGGMDSLGAPADTTTADPYSLSL